MPGSNKPPTRYPIPDAQAEEPHITRLTIRKSRFMAQTCHCDSETRARDFINRIRQTHPDATHNCWAYVAGPPGDTAHIGASDDGEPKGTAGRPMLNVLLHSGTGQICTVVTRWFGGVKLGVGGLVRAYQDATLENLASLPLTAAVARTRYRGHAGYEYLQRIRQIMAKFEAAILQEEYGAEICLLFTAPEDRAAELELALKDATNGQCRFERTN